MGFYTHLDLMMDWPERQVALERFERRLDAPRRLQPKSELLNRAGRRL
jgi:hypothetical protein